MALGGNYVVGKYMKMGLGFRANPYINHFGLLWVHESNENVFH
jgi:hypothetical protein